MRLFVVLMCVGWVLKIVLELRIVGLVLRLVCLGLIVGLRRQIENIILV